MPYSVRHTDDEWEVINSATGRVMGTHSSEQDAKAQLRALFANVPDAKAGKISSQFAVGDRVKVIGHPHMPGQNTGTVRIVNGNAYGIIFDGQEEQGVHKWYTDDELAPAGELPDITMRVSQLESLMNHYKEIYE